MPKADLYGNEIDWGRLQAVHEKAQFAGVSYSLHYSEGDDSWYFSIESASPEEEWMGKNYRFELAIQRFLEWLDRISPKG